MSRDEKVDREQGEREEMRVRDQERERERGRWCYRAAARTPKASRLSPQICVLKPLMKQRRPRASCMSVSRTGVPVSMNSRGGATMRPMRSCNAERPAARYKSCSTRPRVSEVK